MTLILGSMTKARAWKGVGQKCNMGLTFTLARVQECVHPNSDPINDDRM
jgi:hypothetical protein